MTGLASCHPPQWAPKAWHFTKGPVSEYQYYEFRAVDRPLDQRALDYLRTQSTRAEITPTSFINVYHYGDFRGNPVQLMEKYFDAFVYVANWGTHQLMLRLPGRLLDLKKAQLYQTEDGLSVWKKNHHLLLNFKSQTEDYEWDEGEDWMGSLLPVRSELLAGDLRALYLGWLAGVATGEVDEEAVEPPVPPGLGKLSASLQDLASFLRIDEALIEVAAGTDAGTAPSGPSGEEVTKWATALPEAEKNQLLRRLIQGEGAYLGMELLRRYHEAQAGQQAAAGDADVPRRKVVDLLAARETLAEEKKRLAAEKQACEDARRAKEKAAARAQYLEELVPRQDKVWRELEACIKTKRPKDYDRAVELLKDLRDLGEKTGKVEETAVRIRQVRQRHANKRSLMQRFAKAGLAIS
jgi:hypothetical protein